MIPCSVMAEKLVVGAAAAIVRHVEGISDSDVRTLNMSDSVYFNEVIVTNEDSASKIHFPDDTSLTVGPNSRVTIDAFVYDPNANNSKMVVNVSLGIARFVTGKMESAAYQIKTPTSTIGVRGTTVITSVTEDQKSEVFFEEGTGTVTSESGDAVDVGEGLATTVTPGEPPTDPAPPEGAIETSIAEMDVVLLLDGGPEGDSDAITDESLVELVEEVEETRAAGCGC